MIKKILAAAGVAAVFLFGGAAAANADGYPVEGDGVQVSDSTPVVGQSTVITITGITGETTVTFSVTSGPSGATLASAVFAAAANPSVTKPVVDGTASATFTATTPGTYEVSLTGGSGADLGSVTLTVAAAASDGGSDLPATGSELPAAALWLGLGALGLGAIAVVGSMARKRATSGR